MAVACPNTDLFWVALQVRPRSERIVASALESKNIEVFIPHYTTRRKWSDRVKQLQIPLFDGYVFCRLNLLYRLPALTIPGVIQFVGFGKVPAPIEEREIAALQLVMKSGLPSMPWPFLKVGQKVRVDRGPLRDVEGILERTKGFDRLILSVSLLERSIAVEVDRNSVTPITPPQMVRPPAFSAASF